jgi:pseudaminic acid synthase
MAIKIGHLNIGLSERPFIIAEMSGNHNQSLERALRIVDSAAECGAHAIKLQTYTADTMTLDVTGGQFDVNDPDSLWTGQNLHKLYKKAHTPWAWHAPIMARAQKHGMLCFSSPFDETAVDFLENLDVPAFKIASFENNHLPLIAKAASTGKPLIISTGMATLSQLEDAVSTARSAGCRELVLLKCTSTYPATPENTNLRTIPHMRQLFNVEVGLSDHTMGIGAAVAAVGQGATVIEKHFTLSRADGGVDSAFSLEPAELKSLVIETNRAWSALGEVKYGPTEAEEKSLVYRRSIYVTQDINQGANLTKENIGIIRPSGGLEPKYFTRVIGKKARTKLIKGTPISWDQIL